MAEDAQQPSCNVTPAGRELQEGFDTAAEQAEASTMGLWVFLATEVLLFGALVTGYLAMRHLHGDAFFIASGHEHWGLGSANTAILLTSSLTMALAVHAAQKGERLPLVAWLMATALLGCGFETIKGIEYTSEAHEGFFPGPSFTYGGPHASGVELFFWLYYMMTGLHAVHLAVGIGIVTGVTWLAWRGRFTVDDHLPVGLAGLYWHFIDVVWVFLYPLFYLVRR